MPNPPYLIYEVANAHDGDPARLEAIIDALAPLAYPRRGVKFHPIAADALATSDSSFYKLYQALEISAADWSRLIARAAEKIGDVWLEMADEACARALLANLSSVAGVKFQASMLDNAETFALLKSADLSRLKVLANVSGYDLQQALARAARLEPLGFGEIVLQIGYQDYPTQARDLALNKIPVLRAAAPGARLSFADHVEAGTPFALQAPLLAAALGCDLIEKHVCLDRATTRYDYFSSLEPREAASLQDSLILTAESLSASFIPERETAYLEKGLMRPILKEAQPQGRLFAPESFRFRRSDQKGMAFTEAMRRQAEGFVTRHPIEAGKTVTESDFRRARVGAVVAARMKSSRLPRKAVLPVAGVSSIERCLENCLLSEDLDAVVLATSTHPQDEELAAYDLGGRVAFRRGDPEDVIRRYVDVADEFGLDVIIRVTGDCPTMSPEATKLLLRAHFASGADLTRARRETTGTTPHIISVEALRRVLALKGGAPFSEYMNWYFETNPEIFRTHLVDLPEDWIRPYRLTLDYAEDLEMFARLFERLEAEGLQSNLVNILKVLDAHPEIPAINQHHVLLYKADPALIEKLQRETRITL